MFAGTKREADLMAQVTYTFTPYDVLQVWREGQWLDVVTLRDLEDAEMAVRHVDGHGDPGTYRIQTPGVDVTRYAKGRS